MKPHEVRAQNGVSDFQTSPARRLIRTSHASALINVPHNTPRFFLLCLACRHDCSHCEEGLKRRPRRRAQRPPTFCVPDGKFSNVSLWGRRLHRPQDVVSAQTNDGKADQKASRTSDDTPKEHSPGFIPGCGGRKITTLVGQAWNPGYTTGVQRGLIHHPSRHL